MKIQYLMMLLVAVFLVSACNESSKTEDKSEDTNKILVSEVLQTTNYTYLKSGDGDNEKWYALPKMEAVVGDTYYFSDGQEMIDFPSPELKRTFAKVMFLVGASKQPIEKQTAAHGNAHAGDDKAMNHHSKKPVIEQKKLNIEAVAGGITIAELFANKKEYEGKIVKIKAEVTKYNPAIMNKNWIHLQDGTKHDDKYDLTITSDLQFELGQVVTIEGKVVLDKDFGSGYFYDILLEESKTVE